MYKIYLMNNEEKIDTKVAVEANNIDEALKIFKAQVVYKKGVSKNSYIAEEIK